MKNNKIYFDLETTGFNGSQDDLIEIYAIKEAHDGTILGDIHLYFNPGVSLPSRIVEITKITDAMLRDKPSFISQAKNIIDFIDPNDILVGHNAISFDLPFLNNQFKKHNLNKDVQFTNDVIDTMVLARQLDNVGPFTKGYKLIDLANKFKFEIDEDKFHGAKYDVEITKLL
jgi:DNA polymerase-3 subunit alpha (Gram-positive type)